MKYVLIFILLISTLSISAQRVKRKSLAECDPKVWGLVMEYRSTKHYSHQVYLDLRAGKCDFKEWQKAVAAEYDAERALETALEY